MTLRNLFAILFIPLLLVECSSYRQNIMFKTPDSFKPESLKQEALHAERNFAIKKNDLLELEVYSNKGERIIDPYPELTQTPTSANIYRPQISYRVDQNGVAKFPMIGEIKVEGLTLRLAEEVIQKEYEKYFKEPFVTLSYLNKRVIVLGSPGGQVIPLNNEDVNVTEVLALAKGLNNDAIANNIRLLRGEKVFIIDMSTTDGYKEGNILVEPGDIIYVEPVRRPVSEGFRDYSGIFSLMVSILTLIVVLQP